MEEYRDSKGRFKKGYNINSVPIEHRIKALYSMQEAIKNKKNYIGDIKNKYPKIYNSWRAIWQTKKKGKKQGVLKIGKISGPFSMMYFPHIKKIWFLEDWILQNHMEKIILFG